MSQKRQRPILLLVEDDPSMMSLLREVCLMQNYDAREATSGRTALELAARDRPDLVLLDWELPDMSGIDVCQELRRSGLLIPILMLTGRTDDRDVVTGLEHGIDEYLTKPIRPRVLAARLAANLRRSVTSGLAAEGDIAGTAALLERVTIFLNHSTGALRRLAKQAVEVKVKAGAAVLNQGSSNEFFYLIASGSFQVSIAGPRAKPVPVALLGESDFFGAASVLTKQPAAATVAARRDSTLVKISRENLLDAISEGSRARIELERVVAQRNGLLEVAHRPAPAAESTHLISFYSPKGGVGKTTLALNLAATLGRKHPGEVLLLDLSLPYNHAALLAHLSPTSSLARLADAGPEFDQRLESALAYHRAGFFLLSSALAPEESDLITPTLLARAMEVLQPQFRFFLVDLGIVLTDAALSLLEQSQAVFVVASPELLIVKDLISVYGILRDVLKLPEDRIHLVVNHRARAASVGRREIQELLGVEVAVEVRHDGKRPEGAALRGEILALTNARSSIAKAAVTMARTIKVQA